MSPVPSCVVRQLLVAFWNDNGNLIVLGRIGSIKEAISTAMRPQQSIVTWSFQTSWFQVTILSTGVKTCWPWRKGTNLIICGVVNGIEVDSVAFDQGA